MALTGAACRNCRRTEQACAYRQGCCDGCSHWLRYDSNGNDRQPIGRPRLSADVSAVICLTCKRPIPATGRQSCPGQCREVRRAHDRRRAEGKRVAS